MRKHLVFFAAVMGLGAVFFAGPASAQTFIGNFDDWSAFHDGSGKDKVCYIASLPKKEEGDYNQRGRTYVLVTHRPAENSRDVFELRAGYTYKDGSEVTVTIDNAEPFALFTSEGTAWARDGTTDRALARAMMRGLQMTVVGTSSRGTRTTDTYSLKGFTAAHEAIDKECGYTS